MTIYSTYLRNALNIGRSHGRFCNLIRRAKEFAAFEHKGNCDSQNAEVSAFPKPLRAEICVSLLLPAFIVIYVAAMPISLHRLPTVPPMLQSVRNK